jgi:benzylsuccinate CoA-transferase BbsF subunit
MPKEQISSTSPLKGLKVASFCLIAAGPVAMRYLALWGATVVRVESHRAPDLLRVMTPYKDGKFGLDRNA